MEVKMILLITADLLRKYTDIDENVDDKTLESNIYIAQRTYLENLLGTKLYKYYIDKFDNNQEDTIDGNFLYLYQEYIIDVLVFWSKYHSLSSIYSKLTPTGIQNKNSEFSNTVDRVIYNDRKKEIETLANSASNKLREYLLCNMNLFSGYLDNEVYNSQIAEQKPYSQSGIVFSGNKNYNRKDERFY